MKKRSIIFALLVSVLLLVGFSNYSEAASTRATPNMQQVKLKAGESFTVRAFLIGTPTMRTNLKVKIDTANKEKESFLVDKYTPGIGAVDPGVFYAKSYTHMSTFGSPSDPTKQTYTDFTLINMSAGEVTYNVGVNTIVSSHVTPIPHPDLDFNFPNDWYTN